MMVIGMRLPNADRAVVDLMKLTGYCLNPLHPRGRHKARVFKTVLGIDQSGAELLKTFLLHAAREGHAIAAESDEFGKRFLIDSEMAGPAGVAVVRSNWIILEGEKSPRFVSCYVK